ncbi:hypothetical protein D3C86_1686710 [compost metagenome]
MPAGVKECQDIFQDSECSFPDHNGTAFFTCPVISCSFTISLHRELTASSDPGFYTIQRHICTDHHGKKHFAIHFPDGISLSILLSCPSGIPGRDEGREMAAGTISGNTTKNSYECF